MVPLAGARRRAGPRRRLRLRDLPFGDEEFDVAIAISTLEHIGRDNTQYGLAVEESDTLDAALHELRRVAKRLLITVPSGKRSVPELTPDAGYGARGPGATGVLCAELHDGKVSERLRLALHDRRHRGDIRRVTG